MTGQGRAAPPGADLDDLDLLLEDLEAELEDDVFSDPDLFGPEQARPAARAAAPFEPVAAAPKKSRRKAAPKIAARAASPKPAAKKRGLPVYVIALGIGAVVGIGGGWLMENVKRGPQTVVLSPISAPSTQPSAAASDRTAPPVAPKAVASDAPAWRKFADATVFAPDEPLLGLVLIDPGDDPRATMRALALNAPFSLALAPASEGVQERAVAARRRGRELLLAMPLERGGGQPSPLSALESRFSAEENLRRMSWNLARFDDYAGVITSAGPAASNEGLMTMLGQETAARGLMLVDAQADKSVAGAMAAQAGAPSTFADMRIGGDDEAAAAAALQAAEALARARGTALIAVDATGAALNAVERWLAARGDAAAPRIAPASAVVARR